MQYRADAALFRFLDRFFVNRESGCAALAGDAFASFARGAHFTQTAQIGFFPIRSHLSLSRLVLTFDRLTGTLYITDCRSAVNMVSLTAQHAGVTIDLPLSPGEENHGREKKSEEVG